MLWKLHGLMLTIHDNIVANILPEICVIEYFIALLIEIKYIISSTKQFYYVEHNNFTAVLIKLNRPNETNMDAHNIIYLCFFLDGTKQKNHYVY